MTDILWDDFTLVDDYYDDDSHSYRTQPEGTAAPALTPSTLDENQERVLSILLVISATLSFLGSSSIVYKILRDRQQRLSKPYHRTMLALSVADVIASVTFGLYPFLMPVDARIWSFGNDTTCAALGFFTQFSFAAIGYNSILSFYYVLAIKYNVKRKDFSARYEKPMHVWNLAFFLTTASVGARYRFYSPVGKYRYAFRNTSGYEVMLTRFASNHSVFLRNHNYHHHTVDVGMGCWVNDWPAGCHLTGDCSSQRIAILFAGVPVAFFLLAIFINNLIVYRQVRIIFKSLKKVYSAQESSSPQGLTAREAIAARNINRKSEMYDQKLQEVAFQAFLYVGSFLVCYTPALATRLVETFTYNYDDAKIYWLLVITAMTLPLQGFFNMFIYNRPHYVKVREAHPNLSIPRSMLAAFLESNSVSSSSGGFPERRRNGRDKEPVGGHHHQGKARSRFSAVGGSLEIVLEEGSQISDEDDEKPEGKARLDNTTTDNDSTISHVYDGNSGDLDDASTGDDDDAPIVQSPKPTAPAAGIDMAGIVSNSRQLDPTGEHVDRSISILDAEDSDLTEDFG